MMSFKFNCKLTVARFYDILYSDLTALHWSLAWTAMLFGIVLSSYPALAHTTNELSILHVIQLGAWGLLFIWYGFAKLYLVINRRKMLYCRLLFTLFGLVIWSYLFVISATNQFGVSDILFIGPILSEAWILVRILGAKKYGAV